MNPCNICSIFTRFLRILCQQEHCQLGWKETERVQNKRVLLNTPIVQTGKQVDKTLSCKHMLPFIKKDDSEAEYWVAEDYFQALKHNEVWISKLLGIDNNFFPSISPFWMGMSLLDYIVRSRRLVCCCGFLQVHNLCPRIDHTKRLTHTANLEDLHEIWDFWCLDGIFIHGTGMFL